MKIGHRRNLWWGIAVLGAGAVVCLAPSASADEKKHDRKDRYEDRRQDNGGRWDRKRNDSKRNDGKRNDRDDHRRDGNRNDGRYGNGNYGNGNYGNDGNGSYGNGNYGSGNYGSGNYGNNSYTGVVSRVRSDQNFDVVIGGKTYNVYTLSRVPYGLDKNDIVRVSGDRVGNNDIRNARVSVQRNR